MRYDAVLLYANADHDDFAKYSLPAQPPLDPEYESSVAARAGRAPPRQRKSSIAAPVIVERPYKRGRRALAQEDRADDDSDSDNSDEVSHTYLRRGDCIHELTFHPFCNAITGHHRHRIRG